MFLEGNPVDVKKMEALAKKGPKNCQIKDVEEKPERYQEFKTFKVLHI